MQSGTDTIPKRYTYIIGIDEAGRGPVAGPVSVGLVMMRIKDIERVMTLLPTVRDSKKIPHTVRDAIREKSRVLEQRGLVVGRVVLSSAWTVDSDGISSCIKHAIHEGINELVHFTGINPRKIFIQLDGSLHAPGMFDQQTIVKGDDIMFAIALASIYAKTTRDTVMVHYASQYSKYDFDQHKGYGTKKHMEYIRAHGLSDIHRRSFLKKQCAQAC